MFIINVILITVSIKPQRKNFQLAMDFNFIWLSLVTCAFYSASAMSQLYLARCFYLPEVAKCTSDLSDKPYFFSFLSYIIYLKK